MKTLPPLLQLGACLCALAPAQAADPASEGGSARQVKKPDILTIWGDDLGVTIRF